MIKKTIARLTIGATLLTAAIAAQAVPITYTLTDVKFTDGTTATGSFVFDADTYFQSVFDIVTTVGTLPGFEYTQANSYLFRDFGDGPNNLVFYPITGERYFNLSFLNAFTNAGGTNIINTAFSFECNNCTAARYVSSGSVTSQVAAVVPEPVSLALMLPALGALVFRARRRKQARG